jgi:hypothetical protein
MEESEAGWPVYLHVDIRSDGSRPEQAVPFQTFETQYQGLHIHLWVRFFPSKPSRRTVPEKRTAM